MQETMKKGTAVALAAVLLFSSLFPVPLGVRAIDHARYGEAHAIAPAVPVIVCTALAACGVYVAGYEMSQYEGNRDSVASSFLSYVAENLYTDDIDAATAAISSAVDAAGNIDLDALAQSGVLGLIPAFASALLSSGDAVEGDLSSVATSGVYDFGGHWAYAYSGGEPDWFAPVTGYTWDQVYAFTVGVGHPNYVYYKFHVCGEGDTFAVNRRKITPPKYYFDNSPGIVTYDKRNGTSVYGGGGSSFYSYLDGEYEQKWGSYNLTCRTYAVESYPLAERFSGSVSQGAVTTGSAVVMQGVADGVAEVLSGKVQPFEPTAEQLEAGYSMADVVAAIGVVDASLAGVISQVQGLYSLLSPVAGIAQNVQNIRDWWNDARAGFASASTGITGLLEWAGSTPFGTIMQTVIDGVQGIPGAIAGARDAVVAGVGAIPGAIASGATAVLEGVQAIPASIDAVVSAIQSGVLDLTGALDAALHPHLPDFTPPSGAIALPSGVVEAAEFDISNKVPFCYVIRSRDAFSSMFANFSGNRSFYFDLEIPNAGIVRFDGEPVLSQDMGGLDIATTIRVLATALLCLGLLYRAYKVVERSSGSI